MITKTVYGYGINDSEIPVTRYEAGFQEWVCPFYIVWKRMIERCYSMAYLLKRPTYAGCSVSSEWRNFSAFREWMKTQDWEGKHLDKDILLPGNKMYSPDTCIFVSPALNTFLIDCGAAKGKWPIGVCWNKRFGKFAAQCSNPFTGKRGHIGNFNCPEKAHEAWRARKHEHALRYAEMQTDPRIAEALRTRFSPPPAMQEQPQ